MGQEIFYCSRCRRRLTTSDCDKGLGVRIGSRVSCTGCLPQLVSSPTPEEQREFAQDLAARKMAARADPARGSSSSFPAARPAGARTAAVPPRRRNLAPVLVSVGGAGAATLLGILLVLPRRPEPPAAAPVPARTPDEDGRTRAARSAIERARQAPKADLEAQIAAWAEASRQAQGTPLQKEAYEAHQTLLEQRRVLQARDAAELDAKARPLLEREEFGAALESYERARARRDTEEWKGLMDAKVRLVRAKADALFATLLPGASEARQEGREADVRATRDRVARWRLPELADRLEKHLAGVAPADRRWRPVFDGRSLEFLTRNSRPGWAVRDGALEPAVSNAGQTIEEFEDGELRIRFEARDVDAVYFTMRRTPTEGFKASWNTGAFKPLQGKACELVFRCRGDSVTATLNGQPLALEASGRPRKGILQFNARAKHFRIFSIEFRD